MVGYYLGYAIEMEYVGDDNYRGIQVYLYFGYNIEI
jgi:hypothetical protein